LLLEQFFQIIAQKFCFFQISDLSPFEGLMSNVISNKRGFNDQTFQRPKIKGKMCQNKREAALWSKDNAGQTEATLVRRFSL
jgi:hypothetical protein